MLETLFKTLVLLCLPFLGYGFVRVWMGLFSHFPWEAERVRVFLMGGGIMTLAWFLLRRQLTFFATLEHELTHMFVGLLFLKRPASLQVSEQGNGHVTMYGKNFLIALAPYFLPTICLFLLPLPMVLQQRAQIWFCGILGAATAFHFWTGLHETHLQQTDLLETGLWFSLPFVAVANLVAFGAIFAYVRDGYPGIQAFLSGGLHLAVQLTGWKLLGLG